MDLKPATQKIQAYLSANHIHTDIQQLASSTRTAQEAADTLGCRVAQIAKSIVFKNTFTGLPVVVVASGSNRIDTAKVDALADVKLAKADAEFVKDKLGFAIGGVPPISHPQNVRVYLDEDLNQYDVLWAAAGTPHSVFRTSAQMLERLTKGTWLALAQT